MREDRYSLTTEAWQIFLLGLGGILLTWAGLSCKDCFDDTRSFWIVASFTSLMWILLWKGNEYLGHYLNLKISWLHFPVRRLMIGLVVTFGYTFGMLYLVGGIYKIAFDADLTYGAMYSVVITLIISLFMYSRTFLLSWKQTTINAERLERENMTARFESLKSQVNPHFLFNSLNALTNLVHQDPDGAVKFIKQLSEVYRYVLDTRDRETVSLKEELAFLDSYIYLQKIRFGNKLQVRMNMIDTNVNMAPLSLQMLVENAVKHNVMSEESPLVITMTQDQQYISVRNNLSKKLSGTSDGPGLGLDNIRKRYEFLSETPVLVMPTAEYFEVKLPVLKITTGR